MGIDSKDFVIDKAFKLEKRIDELQAKEYYSKDPKKLLSLFSKTIKQIIEIIKSIENEDPIKIKRINFLLTVYHHFLDEIEHIEADNVPVEMLPIFNEILKEYKLKTVLVFRPNPIYNYSYFPIARLIDEISQKYPEVRISEAQNDMAVISFPSSERTSALLHCCFAHEIGHHLNESFSIAAQIEPKILELIDKKLLDKYVEGWLELFRKHKSVIDGTEVTLDKFILKDHLFSRATEEFARIIRKWLDEIVSDIFAIYLFGPAYIFAISEFLLSSQDLEKYYETHPPPFIRIKNLVKLFDELGLYKDLEGYADVIKRIHFYKEISKKTFESQNEAMQDIKNIILERCINALFDLAKALVLQQVNILKRHFNFEDIHKSVIAFRNLIPGNEILNKNAISKPIDAISILNAAWIVRINYIDELYSMLSKTEKSTVRNIIDELTLKALDLQEFHRRMV
ncbi:MAG: hypothetical protein ACPL07_00850 [Candidatus Bathyarchaeia archaeon]